MSERRPDEGLIDFFMRLVDEVFERHNYKPQPPKPGGEMLSGYSEKLTATPLTVTLDGDGALIGDGTFFVRAHPADQHSSAAMALALRRAAKHIDEITREFQAGAR